MITNARTNKKIVSKSIFLTNPIQKGLGLMFRFTPIVDIGYIFVMKKESFVPITMVNVFFPLDILWLNEKKEIIALYKNAKPFQLNINPKVKAKYIVELPVNTIKKKEISLSDKVLF